MTVDPEFFFDSKETVGIYDGFTAPFPTNFWLMQKAPDDKIYMSSRNSSQYMHVIHNPDARGIDCDFIQHDYKLPTTNAFAMPYFPNYRLGADSTWVAAQEVEEIDFTVYPNPATNEIRIKSSHTISEVKIYNTSMQLLRTSKETPIDVSNIKPGIYICEAYNNSRLIGVQKFVVIK